ncbi:MAG: hypothetical protein O6939_00765 [Bacteroidetes bacterium]|nr:hypothetical protein [Bacteroidota bacterium]
MARKGILIGFIIFLSNYLGAQGTYAPLNPDYYYLLDRFEIKQGKFGPDNFSTVKPYQRQTIVRKLDTLQSKGVPLSSRDRFNLNYLYQDSWEWAGEGEFYSQKPFLKHIYKSKSDFYHVKTKDFDLHLNPVLHLGVGIDADAEGTPFINTRGVEFRGMIDEKVGFYSFLGENQAIFPGYVQRYIDSTSVIPHEGFWKTFKDNGVDYFTPKGYITFNASRHIGFQFGYDKNFIGDGYRSLILSDFSSNYLFLKINTQVWRIQYTNLFTNKIADVIPVPGGGLSGGGDFPEKYMSLHRLGINVTDNIHIGLFEAIVFGRQDTLGNNPFKLVYLNPIIFYRAIEQQGGSPDNALLGLDFKWNFAHKFSVYGQFVVDEFLLENLREGNGWWGNKFGLQIGGKYIDVGGIENFDLQLEYNLVRPYAYSHLSNFTNYSNYQQPLAHPLGANFSEFLIVGRYQPLNRLQLTGKLIVSNKGEDDQGSNFGGNILLDNRTREQDFNNEIGQGISTDLTFFDFTTSYQLKHNLFLDVKFIYRDLNSEIDLRDLTSTYTAFAVRLNVPQRLHEF